MAGSYVLPAPNVDRACVDRGTYLFHPIRCELVADAIDAFTTRVTA